MSVDLFGNPETSPARYDAGTRDGIEPWTLQQDMACWPVLLACQSERADLEARRWLCERFGRQARRAGDHRREEEIAKAEWLIINNRVVTRHLSGRLPEVVSTVESIFTGFRTGLPITWGEYHSVLAPYRTEAVPPGRTEKMDRITKAQLRCLLERHPIDADALKAGKLPADLGSLAHSPGRPCREYNRGPMNMALSQFLAADPQDAAALQQAWVHLYLVANN